jgi:hypothetical protein
MAAAKRRATCGELFTKFKILALASKFLLSLLSLLMDNMEKCQTNSDIHSISKRYGYNLHVSNTNLSKYKKGAYYSVVRLFNRLPPNINSLIHDTKIFKPALKDYIACLIPAL